MANNDEGWAAPDGISNEGFGRGHFEGAGTLECWAYSFGTASDNAPGHAQNNCEGWGTLNSIASVGHGDGIASGCGDNRARGAS